MRSAANDRPSRRRAVPVLTAVALALGTVVATVVVAEPARAAADRPSTWAAAKKAPASPAGSWVRSAIGSTKDVDWFAFTATTSTRAVVTLGGLPKDYELRVYDSAGTRIGTSQHTGTRFERVIVPVRPGRYYARVHAHGGYSSKQTYALKFRPLRAGVTALSTRGFLAGGKGTAVGELYNNSSSWQRVDSVRIDWRSASGKVLRSDLGGMLSSFQMVPPHASVPFSWLNARPPTGYASIALTPDSVAMTAPAAQPKARITGLSTSYQPQKYNSYARFTGTATSGSSKRFAADVVAESFSTYGTLLNWEYYAVLVGNGRSEKFDLHVTSGRPNRTHVFAWTQSPESQPLG